MWNIETLLPTKTEFTQFRVQKYKKVWIYANKIEYFAKYGYFCMIPESDLEKEGSRKKCFLLRFAYISKT